MCVLKNVYSVVDLMYRIELARGWMTLSFGSLSVCPFSFGVLHCCLTADNSSCFFLFGSDDCDFFFDFFSPALPTCVYPDEHYLCLLKLCCYFYMLSSSTFMAQRRQKNERGRGERG